MRTVLLLATCVLLLTGCISDGPDTAQDAQAGSIPDQTQAASAAQASVQETPQPAAAGQVTPDPAQKSAKQFTVRLTEEEVRIGGHEIVVLEQDGGEVLLLFDGEDVRVTTDALASVGDRTTIQMRSVPVATQSSISFTLTLASGELIEASLKQGEQARYQVGDWSTVIRFMESSDAAATVSIAGGGPTIVALNQAVQSEGFTLTLTEIKTEYADEVIELTIRE